MTIPLVKPITREVLVTGTSYNVTMTPEHLKLVRKGGRKGVEIPWDDLLAFEHRVESAISPVTLSATEQHARTPTRSILNEVAQDLREASASLSRADEVLTQAGALPAALMAQVASDPTYGRSSPKDHWFVEPLLTVVEVASILRVSTRVVRRLELRAVHVGGEERYQQSVIREYLREQQSRAGGGRR